MPNRALVVASVVVGLGLVLSGTAHAAAELSPATDGAVAGLPVQVSGSCDTSAPTSRSTSKGVLVGLLRGGQTVVAVKASPGPDPGSFTATVPLPQDLAPGAATLASSCGGRSPFVVLAAPTLALTPAEVAADDQVTATGTCPAGTGDGTDLVLAGHQLATATIDSASGRFGPKRLTVPAGTGPGRQNLTSSCGGTATLVVLAPSTPSPPTTTPPPPTLVTVPDLTGKTKTQAVAALGSQLVLGDVSGSGQRITGQTPSPGSRVLAQTSVAVDLAATPQDAGAFPVLVVALGVAALLVLLAAVAVLTRVRRLHRERRWLDEHVYVGVDSGGGVGRPAVPDEAAPGLEIRLVVQREPPHATLQEAGHDRD